MCWVLRSGTQSWYMIDQEGWEKQRCVGDKHAASVVGVVGRANCSSSSLFADAGPQHWAADQSWVWKAREVPEDAEGSEDGSTGGGAGDEDLRFEGQDEWPGGPEVCVNTDHILYGGAAERTMFQFQSGKTRSSVTRMVPPVLVIWKPWTDMNKLLLVVVSQQNIEVTLQR